LQRKDEQRSSVSGAKKSKGAPPTTVVVTSSPTERQRVEGVEDLWQKKKFGFMPRRAADGGVARGAAPPFSRDNPARKKASPWQKNSQMPKGKKARGPDISVAGNALQQRGKRRSGGSSKALMKSLEN